MSDSKVNKLQPLHKDVLVHDMYFGEQVTKSGVILLDDDKTERGIHPRWAKVYAVGPENNSGLQVGYWILILHGRWSRGIELDNGDIVRRVDPKSILGYSTENLDPKIGAFVGPIAAK